MNNKLTQIAFSILGFYASTTYAKSLDTTDKELCISVILCDDTCSIFTKGMQKTPYPWLNQFILEKIFSENVDSKKNLSPTEDNFPIFAQNYKEQLSSEFGGEGVKVSTQNSCSIDDEEYPTIEEDGMTTSTMSEGSVWLKMEESPNYVQVANANYYNPDQGNGYQNHFTYYIFRKDTQSLLQGDISIVGKSKALDQLLSQELSANYSIEDYDEEQSLHANWHLAKNAIVFDYFNWELGFHVASHFPVSVEKLKGLVREDILQAAREWPIPYCNPNYSGTDDSCDN